MMSLLYIENPPQTSGGNLQDLQVTGGSSADPPQFAAGLKFSASRGQVSVIESAQKNSPRS